MPSKLSAVGQAGMGTWQHQMPEPAPGAASPRHSRHHGLAVPKGLWHSPCLQRRSPGPTQWPWPMPVSPSAPHQPPLCPLPARPAL